MYLITSNYGDWEECMLGAVGHIKNYNDFHAFLRATMNPNHNVESVIANLREVTCDDEWSKIHDDNELSTFDTAECYRAETWVSEDGDRTPYIFIISHIKPFTAQ